MQGPAQGRGARPARPVAAVRRSGAGRAPAEDPAGDGRDQPELERGERADLPRRRPDDAEPARRRADRRTSQASTPSASPAATPASPAHSAVDSGSSPGRRAPCDRAVTTPPASGTSRHSQAGAAGTPEDGIAANSGNAGSGPDATPASVTLVPVPTAKPGPTQNAAAHTTRFGRYSRLSSDEGEPADEAAVERAGQRERVAAADDAARASVTTRAPASTASRPLPAGARPARTGAARARRVRGRVRRRAATVQPVADERDDACTTAAPRAGWRAASALPASAATRPPSSP